MSLSGIGIRMMLASLFKFESVPSSIFLKHLIRGDGVLTDLEPDILECEVKWALESITTNKASGGDGIPDRKSTRLNSSHSGQSRMPSSA